MNSHARDSIRRASARLVAFVIVVAIAIAPGPLTAQVVDSAKARDTSRVTALTTVKVTGRADNLTGVAQSASQGRVGRADLKLRPLVREGEILEAVPGMILTQHSGDGKANQMFVRGFNLDHGTDFETKIESMPINMPTHAHGQGYTDLNLLIPELVDHLDYKLGTYYAELGDFGSAGGATLHLARTLSVPIVHAEAGAFGYARTVLGASTTQGNNTFLLGGEAKHYDGPWDVSERLRKFSGMGRWTWHRGRNELSLLALTYSNRWNSSDQIPLRAVNNGRLSRFGQIDPTLGGTTDRQSLSFSWRRALDNGVLRVDAYGIRYAFNLWSNFTYFLDNTSAGDQIEQLDHRRIGGVEAEYTRAAHALGTDHTVRVGVQSRYDDANVALNRSTRRMATGTVRADDVGEGSAALWTSIESRWQSHVRTILGLRGDAFHFDVRSDRAANSGVRNAAITSPKVSLVFGPFDGTEFYVGAGFGFHSNDARGSTITVDPVSGASVTKVDPLVRSRGGELGVRTSTESGFRSSLSLWYLALDSELLFVGDAGTTEPQGRSHRTGITVANFWRPDPRLTFDADVSFTHARYIDAALGQQFVPGALERVIAAGVSFEPKARGLLAELRLRHFGGHPLVEDNSVRGSATSLVNATIGYSLGKPRITASLLNVLGTRASDIQYFYASRLAGEPAGGVEDVHFHPVEPRQIRLGVAIGM